MVRRSTTRDSSDVGGRRVSEVTDRDRADSASGVQRRGCGRSEREKEGAAGEVNGDGMEQVQQFQFKSRLLTKATVESTRVKNDANYGGKKGAAAGTGKRSGGTGVFSRKAGGKAGGKGGVKSNSSQNGHKHAAGAELCEANAGGVADVSDEQMGESGCGFTRNRLAGTFRLTCRIQEDHKSPIYGVAVNSRPNSVHSELVATAGANRISVYQMEDTERVVPLQVYIDEVEAEEFYAAQWTEDELHRPFFAAAGRNGVIRFVSAQDMTLQCSLRGHGSCINDIRFNPVIWCCLFSASKDHSIRMWNVETRQLVVIFSGHGGHRRDVLSVDVSADGSKLASAGMDNEVKIWDLHSEKVVSAFEESRGAAVGTYMRCRMEQIPTFATSRVHPNYVDCVKWFGQLLLSKSTHDKVVLWQPVVRPWRKGQIGDINIVQEYPFSNCNIWFMRFAIDNELRMLAVGNAAGRIFVYDLSTFDGGLQCVGAHNQSKLAVRQTAFSRDGCTLLTVGDDGCLQRWDLSD